MSKQYSDYNSSQTSMLNNSIQYNGRVNTLELSEDPDARFKMFEKIAIKNKATEYREPLKNDFEENALSQGKCSNCSKRSTCRCLQNVWRKTIGRCSSKH